MPIDPKTLEQFEEWNVEPPTSEAHGTEKDVWKNMKRLMPHSWRQEGNKLIGKTEMGELVQTIPTNYILSEVKDGLPKFRKVG